MPKLSQKGLVVPIIILGVVIATITAIGVMRLFSILPGNLSEKEAKSFMNDFAKVISNAKPPIQHGFVAEPPWEAIKLVEKYANGKIEKDARIDYQLYGSSVSNVSLYVFAKPFRWRTDFASSYEDHYRAILINNNGEYSSCYYSDKDGKNCAKVGKLEELSLPYELTNLLNTILDTALLNQFINQIPKASTRTIATKEADCLTINDKHDELHPRDFTICTDKESKMPLFLGFKHDNCEKPMLEATNIVISPLSAEEASPSAELLDKLVAPRLPTKSVEQCSGDATTSGNTDVANWQTYTNKDWGYSIKYPSQFHQRVYESDFKPDSISKPDFSVKGHNHQLAYGGDYISLGVAPAVEFPYDFEHNDGGTTVNIDGITATTETVGKNIYVNTIIHNNLRYSFSYSWTDKKNDDLFYKMLSAFKFLK